MNKNGNDESKIMDVVLGMGNRSIKSAVAYRTVSVLKNVVTGGLKTASKRYTNGISYYLFQPMYSTTGAALCNYLKNLNKKKYAKVADRWMRGVRTDAWFLKPYAMFFENLGNKTYVFARSVVESDGGCAIEMYIIGRDMYREIDKLTLFEKKLGTNTDRISQINITTDKEGHITTSNDAIESRTMDTIYTDPDSKSDLLRFIDRWKDSKELYKRANIIHKTGILLYGKPGTGKTSLVKALASYYQADIININPNDIATSSVSEIRSSIDNTTKKLKIVLLEDIDVVMKTTREDNDNKEDRKTMNGLMQLLDGTSSLNNTIFIATTNYKERLDPAIIRAGRFDTKIEMNDIEKHVAEEMCKGFNVNPDKFFAMEDNRDLTFPVNPSTLQDRLIRHVFATKFDDNGQIIESAKAHAEKIENSESDDEYDEED